MVMRLDWLYLIDIFLTCWFKRTSLSQLFGLFANFNQSEVEFLCSNIIISNFAVLA
jgi:hypothetical protein